MGPKIKACRHFLTNQIRLFTYLFWSLNIFLLINFWVEFSRMFLFCVFSWFVEKYKSVTSMLMWLWSEIFRMFLSMFLELIILKLKNGYSISLNILWCHIPSHLLLCLKDTQPLRKGVFMNGIQEAIVVVGKSD